LYHISAVPFIYIGKFKSKTGFDLFSYVKHRRKVMAATAGGNNVQQYVISRIDYDDEVGYFPTAYISVHGRSRVCALRFEGTLDEATLLAKSELSSDVEDLGVFCRDREYDCWKLEAIISQFQD
jgi:hypothetical protein